MLYRDLRNVVHVWVVGVAVVEVEYLIVVHLVQAEIVKRKTYLNQVL